MSAIKSQPRADALVQSGLIGAADRKPKPSKKHQLRKFAHWGLEHRSRIHYAEIRTIPQVEKGKLPPLPFTTDCSGFVTMAYQYAGCPDPNGIGYDNGATEPAYTGSLLDHNEHIALRDVEPGDLAVFGCITYATGHHVAIVVHINHRTHPTPESLAIISHGQEGDPQLTTVAACAAVQPDGIDGVVYLRCRK